jgi:hypothetical protein
MPLNMNDPYLRAERQPPALVALGVRLKSHYGVGAENFGIKGNEFHDDGYHRSRNFLLNSSLGNGGDYSTNGSLNQGGNGDNNSAFDFTPGTWGTSDNTAKMIEMTKRTRAAARANDPRLADYYEFAGTEDGVHVVTFYAHGGGAKQPFDPSHLHHLHGSKYRSRADNDDTGLGDVLLGIGGEDEDDMGASFGPIEIKQNDTTSLTLPPVQAGLADPREAWVNFCNDTNGADYGLRVWYTTGDGVFSALSGPGWANGVKTLKSGVRESVQLPRGTCGLTISRTIAVPYTGHLTLAIERGKVGSW